MERKEILGYASFWKDDLKMFRKVLNAVLPVAGCSVIGMAFGVAFIQGRATMCAFISLLYVPTFCIAVSRILEGDRSRDRSDGEKSGD